MKPALAQVCSLNSPFDDDIANYASGKCDAIEIWLGKLETYLNAHAVDEVRTLLKEHGVDAPVASFQGGLLTSQGEARKEHWKHFACRLEICEQLAVGTLVVAADVSGPLTQSDMDRLRLSLVQAAQEAGQHRVRLALEFQAQSTFCNNLQTAAALVEETGSPHLGICLDAFHFYTGPSKFEDLAYLTRRNLFHVQLSDLAGTARELAVDADRILPGDGDFRFCPILEHLRNIEYSGHVSIELLNPQIWQVPALSFGEIAMTALRQILGQASMDAAP